MSTVATISPSSLVVIRLSFLAPSRVRVANMALARSGLIGSPSIKQLMSPARRFPSDSGVIRLRRAGMGCGRSSAAIAVGPSSCATLSVVYPSDTKSLCKALIAPRSASGAGHTTYSPQQYQRHKWHTPDLVAGRDRPGRQPLVFCTQQLYNDV